MEKFKIDFFELSYLAEVCIPPNVPIGRAMFWNKLIDEYYHQMNPQERESLFKWLDTKLDLTNESCSLFYARYNPENQFRVETEYNGEKEVHNCFRWNDTYRLSRATFVEEKYITKIEKL